MKWLCLLLVFLAAQVQGQETTFNRPAVFPTADGTYVVGDWKYTFSIRLPGTRSQSTMGRLYYKGKELAAQRNTVVNTPVGEFVYSERFEGMSWGGGWCNTFVDYADGKSYPMFQSDGTVRVREPIAVKRISVSDLLELNKDGTYQAKQLLDWRAAKIGSPVEITEKDNGFLKYRGQISGCDVVALSMDIGSGIYVEDLRIYVQKNNEMLRVLSLPIASRQFLIKEVDGKLNVFIADKMGASAKITDTPAIIIDLKQLVQAYGDKVSPSKKD